MIFCKINQGSHITPVPVFISAAEIKSRRAFVETGQFFDGLLNDPFQPFDEGTAELVSVGRERGASGPE